MGFANTRYIGLIIYIIRGVVGFRRNKVYKGGIKYKFRTLLHKKEKSL